jgi:hypothetical protein
LLERDYHVFRKTGDGNATAYVFALKNRGADEWRDMKALEHTGADGGPVQVSEVRRTIVDPRNTDS